VVGFVTSIPPSGPIAALIIQQSAAGANRRAFFVGLGAALVDAVYATAAVAGVAFVSSHATQVHVVARVAAAVLLPALGLRLLFGRAPDPTKPPTAPSRGLWLGVFISTLNPLPLLSWATLAALLDARGFGITGALIPVFGCAAGAGVWAWNTVLVLLLERHANRLPAAFLAKVVRGLGLLLILLGLWAASGFLRG
jgi:threonine/homoserine/homoserine lactone efflux protein